MNSSTDPDERIDALEARIAHQDQMIEDLNATVTEQWALIEKLRKQMAALDDQLANIEHVARSGQSEAPPPHY